MALRYSAARYALSLRTKHKVFTVAHALQSFDAWEVIPPEAVEAVMPEAEKAVGAAVAQDSAALWTAPAEKADIQKRLVMLRKRQSTTAVRQASGRRRGSHEEMPSAIGGNLLCARWQSGSRAKSEEECGRRHQCAIISRTGRVCGGNHAAAECRDSAEVEAAQPVLLRPATKARPRGVSDTPSSSTARPASPPTLPTTWRQRWSSGGTASLIGWPQAGAGSHLDLRERSWGEVVAVGSPLGVDPGALPGRQPAGLLLSEGSRVKSRGSPASQHLPDDLPHRGEHALLHCMAGRHGLDHA